MTLARRVQDAFATWSSTHAGHLVDTAIVRFHTPRDAEREVVVIIGLDKSHSIQQWELSELRDRIARIVHRAGIAPVSITVRNLDSSIVVTESGWVQPSELSARRAAKPDFPWSGPTYPECGVELDVTPVVAEGRGILVAYDCPIHGLVSIADPLEPGSGGSE